MTKIDIFSGFLGAGKTTLIKKLIQEAYQGEKLVLIENEFGEIGIDGGFLQDAGVEITEMNSGCICCSLVGDFGQALEQVLFQFHPDRILKNNGCKEGDLLILTKPLGVGIVSPIPGVSFIINHFASGAVGIEGNIVSLDNGTILKEFYGRNRDPINIFSCNSFEEFACDKYNLDRFARQIAEILEEDPSHS